MGEETNTLVLLNQPPQRYTILSVFAQVSLTVVRGKGSTRSRQKEKTRAET